MAAQLRPEDRVLHHVQMREARALLRQAIDELNNPKAKRSEILDLVQRSSWLIEDNMPEISHAVLTETPDLIGEILHGMQCIRAGAKVRDAELFARGHRTVTQLLDFLLSCILLRS